MSIKEYLKKNKLTMAQFAKIMGVHYNYISMIIRGVRNPSISFAKEIEVATNGAVTVQELLVPRVICPTCGKKQSVYKKKI
jgi:transcriptional regulator with XRE-family HTH domain